MTDDDEFGDASEVEVVGATTDHRSFGFRRWLVVFVATILAGGAVYVLASSRDGANSAVARDGASDESTTDEATSTTDAATPFATLEPRTWDGSSTTELDEAGGPPASFPGCENRRLPSIVGLRPQDVGPRLAPCGDQFGSDANARTLGSFLIVTMSEPCAPDPSHVGLIASQSPSAGSTFGAAPVRIEVAVYQDCDSTVLPTDFVPPYTFPPGWGETTTTETTTPETTTPETTTPETTTVPPPGP